MNISIKQKQQQITQRNITPNFIRYKRTNLLKKTSNQPKDQQNKITERSTSKASKGSFDIYQKRILNLSKLKNTITIKKKNDQEKKIDRQPKIIKLDIDLKKTLSNQKNKLENQNLNIINPSHLNTNFLVKKKNSGSGILIKPVSRQRYSNPKRTQQSLQKQERRAKLENQEIINNLTRHQHIPNFMNKLKIKKEQSMNIKKNINFIAKIKRNFFQNQQIQLKTEDKLKNYEIYSELGKGAYGIVKMALDKSSKQKVAIKIYQKSKLDQPNKIKNVQRQILLLSRINHATIAKLIEAIQTQSEIYLILQYGGANSLYKYLLSKQQHRLTQPEAKSFFKVILSALHYLHSKNIVHRDIKAQNILINRFKQLKLIDFGFSLVANNNQTIDTFCGTPTYMAPQIVSKKDHVPIYTDMWSLGILFYVTLQGNYPFRAKSQNQLFQKIKKGNFEYIHDDISQRSKILIKGLLNINPLQRYTSEQLMSEQWSNWLDSISSSNYLI